MPRVLFVVPSLSGSMRLLADYLRYLDPSFAVTLFVLENELRFDREFPPQAQRIILYRATSYGRAPATLWRLTRAARQHDLIVGWAELTPTYLAVAAAALARKPVIGWVHANLSRVFSLRQRPRALHAPCIRLLYPRLHAVVGCSLGVAADLHDAFHLPRATAIVNGVDVARIRVAAREEIPPRLQPIFGRPVLINVAQINYHKNPQLLLEAHARLVQEGLPHNLLFVGNGDLLADMQREVERRGLSQRTFFAGYVDNPYPLIAHAHAFVFASRWEGSPLVLAEALALATPVVATDCPSGSADVLDHGRYGLLVPTEDPDALTAALRRLLTDPQLCSAFRALAPEGAQRNDIQPRVRQMETLLRAALDLPAPVASAPALSATR